MYRPTSAVTATLMPERRHEADRHVAEDEGVGRHRGGAEHAHHPHLEQPTTPARRRRSGSPTGCRPRAASGASAPAGRQSRTLNVRRIAGASRRRSARAISTVTPMFCAHARPDDAQRPEAEMPEDQHPRRDRVDARRRRSLATITAAAGRSPAGTARTPSPTSLKTDAAERRSGGRRVSSRTRSGSWPSAAKDARDERQHRQHAAPEHEREPDALPEVPPAGGVVLPAVGLADQRVDDPQHAHAQADDGEREDPAVGARRSGAITRSRRVGEHPRVDELHHRVRRHLRHRRQRQREQLAHAPRGGADASDVS